MTTRMRPTFCCAAALALLLAALALSGCESDPVAPHDPSPALHVTPDGAAQTAGAMGWLVTRVGQRFLGDPNTGGPIWKTLYTLTGAIEGSCDLTFTNNDGTEVPWNQATHATFVTITPLILRGDTFDLAAAFGLTFDLAADINQTVHVATVDGSGTLIMGSYVHAWTISGLVVPIGSHPTGGTLSLTMGSLTAVVTFTGGSTAAISVGENAYTLNLDTGRVTPLP